MVDVSCAEARSIHDEHDINERLEKKFMEWFRDYVNEYTSRIKHNHFMFSFLQGPLRGKEKSYPIYFVNDYKFYTMKRGTDKVTSNSEVCLKSEGGEFYGNLIEIIELEYPRLPIKKTVVFKCDWFDNSSLGTRYHKRYSIVNANIEMQYAKYYPFILASQATQVCYVPYTTTSKSVEKKPWRPVCKVKARKVIPHIPTHTEVQNPIVFQENETIGHSIVSTTFFYIDLGELPETHPDEEWEVDTNDENEQRCHIVYDFLDTTSDEEDNFHDSDDEESSDESNDENTTN